LATIANRVDHVFLRSDVPASRHRLIDVLVLTGVKTMFTATNRRVTDHTSEASNERIRREIEANIAL